ncbi:hypothetical protein NSU_2527 [Novosphingobium pentaromativorans US6-1]|uniref:Uncharacterized protein n=1 Tax=Novosphingobium pentaromativorans US6-1 TaxID=1088721 RepID=G6EDV6_9SPHN|nr:hypothetical protein NSU_2527 [Novosphingobium pentaromativorans US6-1]
MHLGGFFPSGLENTFQASKKSEGKNDLAEIDVLEVTPKIIRILPNEVSE